MYENLFSRTLYTKLDPDTVNKCTEVNHECQKNDKNTEVVEVSFSNNIATKKLKVVDPTDYGEKKKKTIFGFITPLFRSSI